LLHLDEGPNLEGFCSSRAHLEGLKKRCFIIGEDYCRMNLRNNNQAGLPSKSANYMRNVLLYTKIYRMGIDKLIGWSILQEEAGAKCKIG